MALAQYRELAAFAQFASDLDDATREQLEHGQRVTELMKQKQYSPLTVADMAISLYAANEGYLKDIEINKVGDFETALHAYFNSEYKALADQVNDKANWDKDTEAQFKKVLDGFKSTQTW